MRAQITWGILSAAALAAMLAAAAPALGQKAKASGSGAAQILVTEANLPDTYTAVGALIVTVHPKSLSPKTPTRDLLDAELRKQAAKVCADAVIQVRYMLSNPMMSDKGSDAMGVAVKFTRVAAASVPAPPPSLAPSLAPSSAPSPAAVASAPQVAAVSPPPAPAPRAAAGLAPPVAPQVRALAPAPVAPPQQIASAAPVAALPVAAPAPAVVRHATSIDMIVVTEQDFASRRYARVGEVRSEVHQKSLFPKTSANDLLNADLRMHALHLGADAVLQVTYDMHNALTSTQGDIATGVAVRFE